VVLVVEQDRPVPTLPASVRDVHGYTVLRRRQDTPDTTSLWLRPSDETAPLSFAPGQFVMIGRLGVGEVPISVTGSPADDSLMLTIRDVGGVTHDLTASRVGDSWDVRGPYGTGWHPEDAAAVDLVVVAGGLGMAPLRPALHQVCTEREAYRRVSLLYGARSPDEQLYPDLLLHWQHAHDVDLQVTVDRADPSWDGRVGLVTELISRVDVVADTALALLCGPEVMMRFATAALIDRGLRPDRIRWSMERSMACGIGLCGHCQLGPLFVCADGPVLAYDRLEPLLRVREV
jgi:NAD(P)H-flavin reductase